MSAPSEENLREKFHAAYKACAKLVDALDEKTRFTWFLFGARRDYDKKAAESGIEASTLLLGLVVTNTITLGVAVNERGQTVGWLPLGLYFVASAIPLGAMTFLLRASISNKSETKPMHRFNLVTVRMTLWNLLGGFVLVLVTIGLVRANLFPGQPMPKKVRLDAGNARKYDSRDFPERQSLTFDVPFGREQYPEGIPEVLPVTITLTGPLKDSWEILRVDGLRLIDGEEQKETPGPFFIETEKPYKIGVFWQDLKRDASYLLRVYIFSTAEDKEKAKRDYIEASKLITEGQGVTVLDEPPL